MENRIPHIIHYCWFGKNDIPPVGLKCLESWREKLPDYKIIRWDESNFDINSCGFTQKAYNERKYAFVSDYVRLKALYEYGGVYLDIDELVLKDFSDLLNDREIVACFETNSSVMMGLLCAKAGSELIANFIKVYDAWDKEYYAANPEIFTKLLLERGLKPNGKEQTLNNGSIIIYPNEYFCCYDFNVYKDCSNEKSYAKQLYAGTWTHGRSSMSKTMHELLAKIVGEKNYLSLKKIKKKMFKIV